MWESKTEGGGLALAPGLLISVSSGRYPALGTMKRILYVRILSVRADWALDSEYGLPDW